MEGARLGGWRLASIAGLWALTVVVGLGGSSRLTYHEAFVAQAAREMLRGGPEGWLVPTIDGRPWLEKPPLMTWLVAALGAIGGGDATEWAARAPSSLAVLAIALAVATLATRRFGPDVGALAGLVQVSTAWAILRGRLAEADALLAALVAGSVVAFDHLRSPLEADAEADAGSPRPRQAWRWAFWGLLGLTSMAKGIGFGAVLAGSAIATTLAWDRDLRALRRLADPPGWAILALLTLSWPLLVAARHPEAVSLWTLHVSDRMASTPEHFIGGPRWQYLPAVLLQCLPWTPLAIVGAFGSIRSSGRGGRFGLDRLLVAWAVAPVIVLSMATVKNAHYAIHALPPWSIWAALGLVGLARRLESRRRLVRLRPRRIAWVGFGSVGLAVAGGYLLVVPRLDDRGEEWAFCESVGRSVESSTPLACLYEDWDRKPYPTPFGPVPHDWAIRLYSFDRPAAWRSGLGDLEDRPVAPPGQPFALVARDRDRPGLERLGRVELVARGPSNRFDRTFQLYRIDPHPRLAESPRPPRR